jgi:hypothetical protein
MAPHGRQSSTRSLPSRTNDGGKSNPTEDVQHRLARIEAALADMQQAVDFQFKRLAAIQAQLDHIAAKRNG